MGLVYRLLAMLRNLRNRSRIEAEMNAELQAYVEGVADDLAASGLTQAEADRVARAEIGGMERLRQSLRDARAGSSIELIWQDVRYGVRQLLRSPLFTATALFTLALGMGATTAIFSAIYSLLLRPLPYANASRLVAVESYPFAPDFMAMRRSLQTLDRVAGYTDETSANVTSVRTPTRAVKVEITANLLDTLGVIPQMGRGFSEEEDIAGGAAVALISDRLWRSQFGADPAMLAKSITINGERQTVIGILPRGFVFPNASMEPDIFVPARLPVSTDFAGGPVAGVIAIATLRKDADLGQAEAEMNAFAARRDAAYPDGWVRPIYRVESLQRHLMGDNRRPLLLVLGCVVAVLLITCANVANLQLARAAARSHETAVRAALGATQARLLRQFLIENLLLSAAAAAVGCGIVWLAFSLLRVSGPIAALAPEHASAVPALQPFFGKYGDAIHLNGTVALFAVALTLITTLLFGLAPAIQAAKPRASAGPGAATSRITSGPRWRSFRYALLVIEVAAAIALLSTAGLLMRSFQNVMGNETGFDPGHTLTGMISPTDERYQSPRWEREFAQEVLPRLKALPGVEAAALTNAIPLGGTLKMQFSLDGDPNPPFDAGHLMTILTVSPDYFRAVGTAVFRGRPFGEEDTSSSPRVLIVNRNLASRFFAGNAVGERMYVRNAEGAKPKFVPATIVGVAEDVPHDGLLHSIEPELYLPLTQSPIWWDLQIVLRTSAGAADTPAGLASDMAGVVSSVNRNLPVFDVETMNERVSSAVAQRHAILVLMGCFALLAVVLSAGGVCGVFAYAVSQRTQEMGIRLALGASRWNLVRLIASEALVLINIGGVFGLALALVASRSIASMLVGVGQHDPMAFAAAWGLMTALALLASLIPATRAARTDVLSVLRDE